MNISFGEEFVVIAFLSIDKSSYNCGNRCRSAEFIFALC